MTDEELIPKTIVHVIPGEKMISYERYEEIGHGGFGKVFRGKNELTGEIVAIKVISKERLRKSHCLAKHKVEVDIHMSLDHPNIVKALDYFDDGCYNYLILELCVCSLKRKLCNKRRFTEQRTARYLREIIAGVSYLHDNRIIHRDLKLENFLLDSQGRVKIADFGLSTKLKHNDDRSFSVCGTPNYMSPEMISHPPDGVGYEVDIWAIGISAFAMLTGQLPFQAQDKKHLYEMIKSCKYMWPPNLVKVSTPARRFVRSLLQRNPSKRPTALDLMDNKILVQMERGDTMKSTVYLRENQNDNAPIDLTTNHMMCAVPDCFVLRFCDQSQKFGLGYLLLNGTVGACFRDESRMVIDPHRTFIQYWENYSNQIPQILTVDDKRQAKKIKLLQMFADSLKDRNGWCTIPKKPFDPSAPMIHVKYWYRCEYGTLFRMDDRNIQVNFPDKKKLIIFWKTQLMMVVQSLAEQGRLLPLSMMLRKGLVCDEKERFVKAKTMLDTMSKVPHR